MSIFHFDHHSDQHPVWLRGATTAQHSRCFPGARVGPLPVSKSHADACATFGLCSSKLQNFPYLYEPKKLVFDRTSLSHWASQVAPVVKNLPASAERRRDIGLIPGWEDPLEEGMATYSSLLAWRILWTEEPSELQSIASQIVRPD